MRLTALFIMCLFVGCASTRTVDKTETTTTTTSVDTSIVVKIPEVSDSVATRKVETDTTETWVSDDTSVVGPVKPKFTATRNKKTGATLFTVKVPDQKVDVVAKKTVVNEKKDVQTETKSWLSEIRGIVMWVVVGLVALLIGFGIVKKTVGL
jgi:hypothetical protein